LYEHLNVSLKIGFYVTVAIVTFDFIMPNLSPGQSPQNSAGAGLHEDGAMDFDQAKSTYHFKLLPDGGIIEITANDSFDAASRNAIQRHAVKIATMFGRGDFNIPTLGHGQKPAGVDTMERLKSAISYTPENVPTGGRVRITTADSEGLKAVHDFLRFQIQEHKTGDSLADPVAAKRKHPANNLGHDAQPAQP
jgi:hypothetical protein